MHNVLNPAILAILLASVASAQEVPSIDAARRAYHTGDYGRSLALFERLARERDDAEAAESAGFMLLQGPALYGSQVRRDPARATVLLVQAARAGRPGAEFMLNMLDQAE